MTPTIEAERRAAIQAWFADESMTAKTSGQMKYVAGWLARSRQSQPLPVWIAVSERLPEPGVIVIAYYKNELGKDRRIRAAYHAKFTHEASIDNDDLDSEYDETTDYYYWPAGWYEQIDNWDDYSAVAVHDEVTHWMPLPSPPAAKEAQSP